MAGHSHWANIKHKKAALDARRGKVWSKCARAIIVAARHGGGDPETNLTLRYAVDDAKAQNMPKDTIANAIKKGTGELGGEDYEPVLYEGYGPGGVAMLIETLTNNRNRTVGDLRTILSKRGGSLATSGAVSYQFAPKGQITIERAKIEEDRLMELVLDAGAEDVAGAGEEYWLVTTEQGTFRAVKEALTAAAIELAAAELTRVPSTSVAVAGEDAKKVLQLVDELEDLDDVQKVHANFDIPAEELAGLRG